MTVEYLNHAIIELTSECNLQCRHCYNWWKQEGKPVRYQNSYHQAFRLLQHLMTTTTVEHFTFTGGEPTMSERFIELVLHAKLNKKKSYHYYQWQRSKRDLYTTHPVADQQNGIFYLFFPSGNP
ncbi:MAG: radical SAM protein [Bacteroides sp.]|nr:radical SAM protein [Bacteroides sp.]